MSVIEKITLGTVTVSKLKKLKEFYIKAYGSDTIFQNEIFLRYYFALRNSSNTLMRKCIIGISPDGEIVSHYGGLDYNLKINHDIHSIIWGVSAYTLPEWRGKGFNSKIVAYILKENEINGVIGFSRETASFYRKLGYNVFNFERFARYVLILNYGKTKEIVDYLKQDANKVNVLPKTPAVRGKRFDHSLVVELTKENFCDYKLSMDEELTGITTTHRTTEFLFWRFFGNPYIKYSVYGFVEHGMLLTYIALREESVAPFNYKVSRIIDLYGKTEGISILLNKSLQESVEKNHIYIDFSMFGTIYDKELVAFQFIKLENEDCCVLPQVTAPVENRTNGEYIGIQSALHKAKIESLAKENVYFTRMDSDRDRLSKLFQIEAEKQ